MHSLDINFLNDRAERPAVKGRPAESGGGGGDINYRPLIIGAIAAVIPLAGILGFWFLTKTQVSNLQAEDQRLEQELQTLNAQLAALDTQRQQITLIEAENRAMANVLPTIRPWSALLFDIQQRTPARVQLAEIEQTEGLTSILPTGEESPLPELGGVAIRGTACSVDDVNDFILVVQRSEFFVTDKVELVSIELLDDDENLLGRCPGDAETIQTVQLVEYEIEGNLVGIPQDPEAFTTLVNALEQNNAIGLIARIRALQNIGVIEP